MPNIELPYGLVISQLGLYPRELETFIHTETLYVNVHNIIIIIIFG